jgi:hypothetical protein
MIDPLLPRKIAAGLLVSFLLIVAAFAAGWNVRSWKADSDNLEEVRKAELARDKAQAKLDAKASELETTRALIDQKRIESRSTIREIYRDVPAPPVECAAPPAARRLLIDAGATGSRPDTAKPARTVPGDQPAA